MKFNGENYEIEAIGYTNRSPAMDSTSDLIVRDKDGREFKMEFGFDDLKKIDDIQAKFAEKQLEGHLTSVVPTWWDRVDEIRAMQDYLKHAKKGGTTDG